MDLRYWLSTKVLKNSHKYRNNHFNNGEYCVVVRSILSEDLLKTIVIVIAIVVFILNLIIFASPAITFEEIKPILEVLLNQSEQSKELLPLINWNGIVFSILFCFTPLVSILLWNILDEHYCEENYVYKNQKVENL